jgi:hypothetical protein
MSSKRARESPAPGEQGKRQKVTKTTVVYPSSFSKDDKDEVRSANLNSSSAGPCPTVVRVCVREALAFHVFVHFYAQAYTSSAASACGWQQRKYTVHHL